MKRTLTVILLFLVAFCMTGISETASSGLSLELGIAPQSIGLPLEDCDPRIALSLFLKDWKGKGGVIGVEAGAINSQAYLGPYYSGSQSLLLWKKLGIRGEYRQGGCYLFGIERLGVMSGLSGSIFWERYEVIASWTAITYILDSVYRSLSGWHVGLAVSFPWP